MATEINEAARLREDLTALREDFSKLAESLRAVTEKTAKAGVGAAKQRAGQAREQADEWVADLGEHIEQRPFGSVLMAFGLGFVIGKLLDRS